MHCCLWGVGGRDSELWLVRIAWLVANHGRLCGIELVTISRFSCCIDVQNVGRYDQKKSDKCEMSGESRGSWKPVRPWGVGGEGEEGKWGGRGREAMADLSRLEALL